MLFVFQCFPVLHMYTETAVTWHNFCIDFISGIAVLDDWHAGIYLYKVSFIFFTQQKKQEDYIMIVIFKLK